MSAIVTYFRQHRWQRRLLTVLLALVIGGATATLALPWYIDTTIIRDMGSADRKTRVVAAYHALARARQRPAMVRRMAAALPEASDTHFQVLVGVLETLDQFDVPGRDPNMLARRLMMQISGNPLPAARRTFFIQLMSSGWDNPYVRQALGHAIADPNSEVREVAGILAARLGDDVALGKLIGDDDPNVSEVALIDAALADRRQVLPKVFDCLSQTDPSDLRLSSASWLAIAALDPNMASRVLPSEADAFEPVLQDRLLYVLGGLDSPAADQAILKAIERAEKKGQHPSAAAIEAAARRKLVAAAPAVRRILAAATESPEGLVVRQLHAAILAADALDLPVRREVHEICRLCWTHRPGFRLMLTDAARLLGRQVTAPQGDEPNVPSPEACIRTLRQAAVFEYAPTTWPATRPRPEPVRSPLPSAAAAVELWLLDTKACDEFIQVPAEDNISLSGDYVGWHVGKLGGERAFQLGLKLLPPLDADPNWRVYDDDTRSAGAMLLAIAADTPERRTAASRRIRSRLIGADLGGEDSFYVRGAYQCALAILGDPNAPDEVLGLLETAQFSQRRAITALTLAGDLRGLDWLLWNLQIDPDDVLFLLVDDGIGEVIADCLPGLPRVSPAATEDLAEWQCKLLRHAYLIRRPSLKPALR